MVESLVPKDLFIGLDRCIWMYTGAEGPALRRHFKATEDYFRSRSKGPGGREQNTRVETNYKEYLARLVVLLR